MKERGPWRLWSTFLLFLAGNLCNSIVLSQNYDGARGDSGDSNPAPLGFDGVLQRHDGYVKGETPTIPQTSFSCSAQPYNPGLYADTETQCQVYHVCFEDRQESFLCGPGTNFNQRILACDFWYNFDCNETPNFYSVNADIGKVPDKVFSQGARVPQQPQQPRYPQQPQQPQQPRYPQQPQQPQQPSYPQQPAQPPSVGSYPPQVSVPPPPARPSQPPPPPRIQPQEPIYPQIPQEPVEPQPPRVVPQPPRIQPQPPRVQPPSVAYPPPPQPRPQPRPDPPRVSVQPQYPRIPQGSGQPAKRRPPPQQQIPPTQQEEENGYQFDGYNPSRPSLPPPPPPRVQPPRHEFPPVVSPPRVSRPPLTPPIIRQPEISRPRPAIDTRTEYHPDAEFKGSAGYRPPQQPPRLPQPSQPVGSGYPGYPVAQRPISPGPVAQRPVVPRPVAQIPVAPRPVAQIPVAPRPVAQRPVAPRPVAQRPIERPSRPAYQPPQTVQQEHVDTEYVPPPPPPRPIEPSRPSTTYVPPPPPPPRVKEPSRPSKPYVPPPPPPPPRPVQQEVTVVRPPQPVAQRPAYVPPPVIQRPVDNDYNRPQPPISPSVIREQQKPASPPPSRPQVSVGSRQPQRPKPVFPPASDHPNSNIKGGPGYSQPPPQIPRFEPTRISRPSSPQGGYEVPSQANRPRPVSTGTSSTAVKQTGGKTPTASGQAIYKPPQQERVKKPSEPPRAIYQPPIQVIDHPQVEIKGVAYDPSVPQTPQRVQSPSTSVVGVKRPQATSGQKQPQPQRPRAPVVISRPQPPSIPATNIKTISPVDNQVYEKPRPQPPAPSRVKQPSISQVQTVSRPNEPRFPTHDVIDHPNANVKGVGSGYNERRPQPIAVSRPSSPPSSPSTSYEQKTTSVNQGRGSGSGYPSHPSRGDIGSIQQIIKQQEYKPIRTSPPSSIKTVQKITAVKDSSSYQRPPEVHQHTVLINKQSKPDYEAGASYTRGPETYPKPEFGKPHTPVSTPSRLSPNTKQGSPSQNTITRTQNKPSVSAGSVPSVSAGSGSGSDIRPDLPFDQVPGYQPPYQRQVFPHRENPDHPNESIKGSGAYRPPPPAGFQAAASEIDEQKVAPEPEPAASLHGDTGSE